MRQEDFEDLIRRSGEREHEAMLKNIDEFKSACMEGYQMIEDYGVECIDKESVGEEVERAFNKMLGYFIELEEYEKCEKIKAVYVEVFNKEPIPEKPNFI